SRWQRASFRNERRPRTAAFFRSRRAQTPRARPFPLESGQALTFLRGACPYRKTGTHFSGTCALSFAHVLIGKPAPSFPGHALTPRRLQKVRAGGADALDLRFPALDEAEHVDGEIPKRFAHLDAAGLAVGFHARCGIHRIAPHIIGEASVSD